MPRPPPDGGANMEQLLAQMKREVLDEVQSAITCAHEEDLQQQRLLIQGQEIMQKMLVRLLSMRSVDAAASATARPVAAPVNIPVEEKQVTEIQAIPEPAKEVINIPEQVPEQNTLDLTSAARYKSAIVNEPLKDNAAEAPVDPLAIKEGAEEANSADQAGADAATAKASNSRGSTWITENTPTKKAQVDVHALLNKTGWMLWITESKVFVFTSFFMIVANAIYIGVESDWNTGKGGHLSDMPVEFQFCEHAFCTFFTIELVCRFLTFAKKKDCFKDNWFVFDLAMVIMMVADTWILALLTSLMDEKPDTGTVGGIGRLLRLLRLTRISRLMKLIPELVTMVKGMVAAIRAVHAALIILFLLIYVFAIVMHSLVGAQSEDYFPTVRDSMVTLMLNGVLLDSITELTLSLIAIGDAIPLIMFGVFVLLSALTVMNMLIGVLCQVVLDVSAEEEENNVKAQMAKSLLVMLEDLDDDKSGQLSKTEVQDVISEPLAISIMKDIQVDTNHLLDLTEMLYPDESSTLPIPTFMNILLQLRGKRPVTMNDLAKANNFMMWAMETQLTAHRNLMIEAVQEALRFTDLSKIDTHNEAIKEYHRTLQDVQSTFTQHRLQGQAAGMNTI